MAVPQQSQRSLPEHNPADFAYSICRTTYGRFWMLAGCNPRRWTTKEELALVFYDKKDAEECIDKCANLDDVSIIRIRTGA